MPLPASFLDELRARTPLAALVGRRVKLERSGRNWRGCCPFHGEKTPSFFVYEDHYHCFGCGVHGDAVSFVMASAGASFPEAVESLAAEAGLEVPKASREAEEQERRRLDLHEILVAAEACYRRRLFLPEGAAALAYLRRRGLADETIARFGLGWSGEGRGALLADLAREGIERERLAETGLLRVGEDGQVGGELFFSRVMFPIRDRRGRTISFGGRTLGDGQPKYLNGPETPLFAKRRALYGLDLAREPARTGTVIVVEGYLDVTALSQAGFGATVAPLGTALTAEQLELLWKLSPAPVLCFDGDAAGSRAAARALSLALPLITAERSLSVASLPAGEDPDTLVRSRGADGVRALIDNAKPMVEAIWSFAREGASALRTPEQAAHLLAQLERQAAMISDRGLAGEYKRALKDRFYASRRRSAIPVVPRHLRPGAEAMAAGSAAEQARLLTAILLRHPELLHDVEEAYAGLDLPPPLARLRRALLSRLHGADQLDSGQLIDHLHHSGLGEDVAATLDHRPLRLPDCASPDAMPADAEAGWWHIFGMMHRDRLDQEVAEAADAFVAQPDDAARIRLQALREAQNALRAGGPGFGGEDAPG